MIRTAAFGTVLAAAVVAGPPAWAASDHAGHAVHMMPGETSPASPGVADAATPAPSPSPADIVAATERNRALVTAFVDRFYGRKDVRGAFETYVAPGYIQHNPMAADGRDAAVAGLSGWFAAMPQLRFEVQRIIVDGNLAAVHVKMMINDQDRGSAVVDLFRIENGKIAEHWDVVQAVPDTSANPHPMF